MPCMNSTSAGDRGGRVGRVDEGRVLVGVPGAPGCTTTGLAESGCWLSVAGTIRTVKTPAASNARRKTPRLEPGLNLGSRRTVMCLRVGMGGKIFIWGKDEIFS